MANMIITVLSTGTVLALAACGIVSYGAFAWHILEDTMHPSK